MGEKLKQRLKQESFASLEQEVLLNLMVTANYIKSIHDTIFSEYDITISQYNVLRILKGAYPKGYPRFDIINRMIDPSPDVTRLIDRLIKAGYVERINSSSDKRLSISKITKKGLMLVDKLQPSINSMDKLINRSLTREESKKLSELCEKIYEV